jgi:hypothetical protein
MALIPPHGKKGLAYQFWKVSAWFRVRFVVDRPVLIEGDSIGGLFTLVMTIAPTH